MNERTINMLREITTAVNRGGMDTALDMPDYVIAGYLYRCLMALKLSKEETQTFSKGQKNGLHQPGRHQTNDSGHQEPAPACQEGGNPLPE